MRQANEAHTTIARNRVVVALPSVGQVHHACMESLRAMIRATRLAEEVAFWWENDQPHDRCRNSLLKRFHDDDHWTHLLFVDSDEVVQPETLDRLLSHSAPIVCAPVPTLHQRYGPTDQTRGVTVGSNIMVFDNPSLRGSVVSPEDPDVSYRRVEPDDFPDHPFVCDSTGLGLCLIQRTVIETIQRPWCRFIGQFADEYVGEDVYFFRKARAAGFEILVDPTLMPDHYKQIDLTHLDLLYTDKLPVSSWPRLQEPNEVKPVFVAVRVPRTGWLHVRAVDTLQAWENKYGDRVLIEPIHADTARGGLVAVHRRMQTLDARFAHVLLLGDDVVPHDATLDLLSSVNAPIVAGLTRTLIDGLIRWAFWTTDPLTRKLVAPQNIRLPDMKQPFEVAAVDPACVLVERSALAQVASVMSEDDNGPDADRLFAQRWCQAVTDATGRPPVQTPLTVERRSEVGLRGLLAIKMKLRAQLRAAAETPAPQVQLI